MAGAVLPLSWGRASVLYSVQNTVMRRDLTRFLLHKPSMFFLKNGI